MLYESNVADPVGFTFQAEDDFHRIIGLVEMQQARKGMAVNPLRFNRPVRRKPFAGQCFGGQKSKVTAAGVNCCDQKELSLLVEGVDKQDTAVLTCSDVELVQSERDLFKMYSVDQISIFPFSCCEVLCFKENSWSFGVDVYFGFLICRFTDAWYTDSVELFLCFFYEKGRSMELFDGVWLGCLVKNLPFFMVAGGVSTIGE